MSRSVLVVSLCILAVQAGFFDDMSSTASDVGDFFNKQFQSVKDLFANNQGELEKNINRVKDLLNGLKEKTKMLEPMASDAQKQTLAKVGEFTEEVNTFATKVETDGEAKFEENKEQWSTMLKDMFEKNGLGDLVKLVQKDNAGQTMSFMIATAVPVILALCR